MCPLEHTFMLTRASAYQVIHKNKWLNDNTIPKLGILPSTCVIAIAILLRLFIGLIWLVRSKLSFVRVIGRNKFIRNNHYFGADKNPSVTII